jgi:hypothetical protein
MESPRLKFSCRQDACIGILSSSFSRSTTEIDVEKKAAQTTAARAALKIISRNRFLVK